MASLEQQNSTHTEQFAETPGDTVVLITSSSAGDELAEQDSRITSSENLSKQSSSGVSGNHNVTRRPFLCGTTVPAVDESEPNLRNPSFAVNESGSGEMENGRLNDSNGLTLSSNSASGVTDSSNNICDSVASSSSAPNSVQGGATTDGDPDGSAESVGGSSHYRVSSGIPEDDAGSSSHSEVRSSSPGIADADADVEDSPSGSEETGSESEQRFNSANHHSGAGGTVCVDSSNMYAPNTVGFPPSRSTEGCFGSGLKYPGMGSNPFAVKSSPFPVSSVSSNVAATSSGSNQAGSFGDGVGRRGFTRIVSPGRWSSGSGSGPVSPKATSTWSSRPIIRPSALGSVLGGSGVSSSTSATFGQSQAAQCPNYFAMSSSSDVSRNRGFGGNEISNGPSSNSSFALRPPRLAATSSFAMSTSSEPITKESSLESTDNTNKSEADLTSTEDAKSSDNALKFVPLSKDKESVHPKSSENSATTSTPISSSTGSTGASVGFVFGQGLQDRVENVQEGDAPNGVSSSTSGGLFASALQDLQKNGGSLQAPPCSNDEAGSSSSDSRFALSNPTDVQLTERKRRYDDSPVLTGEENEINVLQVMSKLFIFDSGTSSWTERGRGQLRLNDRNDPTTSELRSRLIIRTKGSLRLMLNTNVWPEMKVDRTSNKSVRFTAYENGQIRLFLVMVTVNEADQLFNALDWRINNLKRQVERKSSRDETSPQGETGELNLCDETAEDSDADDDDAQDLPTKKKRYLISDSNSSSEHGSRNHSQDNSSFPMSIQCPTPLNTPSIQISNHDNDSSV